jgi:hypothetical protein
MATILTKTITIPETIVQRKVIVFKPSFGIKAVRKIAEKTKNQMFKKYLFLKSKPEETKIDSIDKYFEQYIVIDGKYIVDYSKNWNHLIQVDEEMQKLKISNKYFEPKLSKNHLELPYKILELKGTGRFYHESRLRIIFDQKWNEVGLERLPYLPFEEEPQELLEETENQPQEKEFTAEKEVDILKGKIFKRPSDTLKIYSEIFKVTERALIFKPMYKVRTSHTKTQKKVTFLIDGGNGKITLNQKEEPNTSIKVPKDIVSEVYTMSKDKAQKIYDILKKNLKIKK